MGKVLDITRVENFRNRLIKCQNAGDTLIDEVDIDFALGMCRTILNQDEEITRLKRELGMKEKNK